MKTYTCYKIHHSFIMEKTILNPPQLKLGGNPIEESDEETGILIPTT